MPAAIGRTTAERSNPIVKMNPIKLPENRTYDAVCLGRAGVDLYACEPETDFTNVAAFEKHVGGSPANIAIGMARLGGKIALCSVVSDDMLGHYVINNLQSHGVDTTAVHIDSSGTRTSLAITEVKAEDCGVVIYRNSAADLLLNEKDIPENLIKNSKFLIISGTALSQEPSRSATLLALSFSHQHSTFSLLDLDYRPYSWSNAQEAAECYQHAAKSCDILIGNREEFTVMFGETVSSEEEIAAACFEIGVSELVIIKDGGNGSVLINKAGNKHHQPIFPVKTLKPFGAGDAFAAAFCMAMSRGKPPQECAKQGAAAAAIVVARTGCGVATPDPNELGDFINRSTLEQPKSAD